MIILLVRTSFTSAFGAFYVFVVHAFIIVMIILLVRTSFTMV